MQPKESIEKTKKFFQKSLKDLKKTLFCGGYQRLPRSTICYPFSCSSSINTKNHRAEQYYTDFCDDWQCDLDKAIKRKNNGNIPSKVPIREEVPSNPSSMRLATILTKKEQDNEKKNKRSSYPTKSEDQCANESGGSPFTRKMKELEMMDANDVEHVLDVEEAVHYYSRLRSPVYLDIVDKFFMDMYAEFSVQQASATIASSKRRLGSIRL